MVFFEVGCFELRQKGNLPIKNEVFFVGDLFNKNKIDRSLISEEQREFFLFEGIAFSAAAVDAGQIDDVSHPEDGIPHLIAVAYSLSLRIQVELLEKSKKLFTRLRERRSKNQVFCAVEFLQDMCEIPLYRLRGVFQLK